MVYNKGTQDIVLTFPYWELIQESSFPCESNINNKLTFPYWELILELNEFDVV